MYPEGGWAVVSAPLIHRCYWFCGRVLIWSLTGLSMSLWGGAAQLLRPDASFVIAANKFGYMLLCSCAALAWRTCFAAPSSTPVKPMNCSCQSQSQRPSTLRSSTISPLRVGWSITPSVLKPKVWRVQRVTPGKRQFDAFALLGALALLRHEATRSPLSRIRISAPMSTWSTHPFTHPSQEVQLTVKGKQCPCPSFVNRPWQVLFCQSWWPLCTRWCGTSSMTSPPSNFKPP